MMPTSHSARTGFLKKGMVILFLSLVLCAGGSAWGDDFPGDAPAPEPASGLREAVIVDSEPAGPLGAVSADEGFAHFDEFIIRLTDDNSGDRILVCALSMELNPGMALPKERFDLRKIIYKTLKEHADFFKVGEGIREEIRERLNDFMGKKKIKNVYFTKFIVL
jgi:flagellar basal body-associated protein FliL